MLIIVGTSAVPRRAISSIRSSDSPVPCSTQSIPARTRVATACSENVWAVIRTPAACAAATAPARVSSSQAGARSPIPRSIQSPTSFTQPLPARAWAVTVAATSSAGTSIPMSRR